LRHVPTGIATKRQQADAAIDRIEILAVGPSHTEQGLYPALFRRPAYNLAQAAQDLYYDEQLVEMYLPRARRLNAVLITLSYISFEYQLSDAHDAWRTHLYSLFFGIPNERWAWQFSLDEHSALVLYGPERALELARDRFRTDLGAKDLNADGSRSVVSVLRPARVAADGAARFAVDRRDIMRADRFAKNAAVLEHLVELLAKRGIQPILITLPVLPSYSSRAVATSSWMRMQEEIANVVRKYGARYYNYFADARFSAFDFANADHLNQHGAVKLSRIVDDEIIARLSP